MSTPKALPPAALYGRCDPAEIPFETTADAAELDGIVGQDRAVEAVRFGIGIRRDGYNLFAMGPPGVGKRTLLRQFLEPQAARETTPADWCYVHHFGDPHRPRALTLPAGRGARLRADMERAVAELRVAMRAAFDSEEYRTRKQQLVSRFQEQQERAFVDLQERAKQRGVAVVRTEDGLVVAPLRDGAPLKAADFQRLPRPAQAELQAEMERVGGELQSLFQQFHDWAHQHHEALTALDREIAAAVVRRLLDEVRRSYPDLPAVLAYLSDVEKDVIENADDFLEAAAEGVEAALRRMFRGDHTEGPSFRRYQVNVLVDHGSTKGAPVVYEDHPTYANLIGRIEHVSRFGALVTDFTLLKPGVLHRARGGYLLLDALKVLQQPFAWDALKRALRSGQIRIESLGELLGVLPTVSLEPEPIPLDGTKVVLVGQRLLYYLLAALDPDFLELFKVIVDFEESMDRQPATNALYAKLVAGLVRKERLRPLDRSAVARVIEHAARLVEDAEKLSLHMRPVVDLLREADFWAGSAGATLVTAGHVQAAIEAQLRRAGRARERWLEAIQRQTILIDTTGEAIGQVNGLSVVQLGEHFFGHPSRITARARVGKGEVVDIEREVELGGPIHSKGVLILSGFLGTRYAAHAPLSLSATLVFEQTYAQVEGDSASLAEACALLSALADLPVTQRLALTGSINQLGQVQAIGAVNEKVEGFFDVCRERGLTGDQGVVIPRSNVKNLMLRRDVVEAVEAGRFRICPVTDVDEAVELLTGRPAGARDAANRFPQGSVNALVEARLIAFAEAARAFIARAPAP